MTGRVVVLIVASGASWEPEALRLLGEHPRIVLLKRCVDVADLLAAASAGQADVAVVGLDAPGLDRSAVDRLRGFGVRAVAVAPGAVGLESGRMRAGQIGIPLVVAADRLDTLAEAVCAPESPPTTPRTPPPADPPDPGLPDEAAGPPGRVVAVWGPAGAPGRTTLAAALAAELSRRRRRTVLIDADPYGGALAQQLGILDEVSGLLAAARLAGSGQLRDRLDSVQRALDAHLRVVTGLPRGDRWVEVRQGVVAELVGSLREHAEVVLDTGFDLEAPMAVEPGGRPGRNQLTLEALEEADEVVVVGGADPVGLSRLVRGLVDLADLRPGPVHVAVNRMRPTLGWTEREVSGMVAGFGQVAGVHFLPDDQATVDRALIAGRTLVEVGDSALLRAVSRLADTLVPVTV